MCISSFTERCAGGGGVEPTKQISRHSEMNSVCFEGHRQSFLGGGAKFKRHSSWLTRLGTLNHTCADAQHLILWVLLLRMVPEGQNPTKSTVGVLGNPRVHVSPCLQTVYIYMLLQKLQGQGIYVWGTWTLRVPRAQKLRNIPQIII